MKRTKQKVKAVEPPQIELVEGSFPQLDPDEVDFASHLQAVREYEQEVAAQGGTIKPPEYVAPKYELEYRAHDHDEDE